MIRWLMGWGWKYTFFERIFLRRGDKRGRKGNELRIWRKVRPCISNRRSFVHGLEKYEHPKWNSKDYLETKRKCNVM